MAKFFWPFGDHINGVPLYSKCCLQCKLHVLSDGSRVGYLGEVFTEN